MRELTKQELNFLSSFQSKRDEREGSIQQRLKSRHNKIEASVYLVLFIFMMLAYFQMFLVYQHLVFVEPDVDVVIKLGDSALGLPDLKALKQNIVFIKDYKIPIFITPLVVFIALSAVVRLFFHKLLKW